MLLFEQAGETTTPSMSTILAFVFAVILLYLTIGKNLIAAIGAQKEVAGAERDKVKTRDDKIAELNDANATLREAYKIALLEVDTSRLIRLDHKDRIRQLETELAVARGLRHDEDFDPRRSAETHRTET